MSLPRTTSGVIVQQQDGAFFLMDTEGGEVFRVNETAARIFELCRGGTSLEDAVQTLARGLEAQGQEAAILADVQRTVAQFQELGLCEPSPAVR
ncbi:PqqD family protein [Corallococcus sp. BB11-1]|uniref:PqqD family protein n=1 Tax=Corallococcus sp. BB11-1 TaxID=2996783 RepID=UPI0022702FEA|nr:PqqD family protein [Corallococcus sp. BB11-1]MCY1032847.1 PqqD family protein [Corallococcus sp. BB11-1]